MTNIVSSINEWISIRQKIAGKSVGFIPTMGHLHAGHLSLCERSKKENDITVVSIFVNPTQFNQTNDFDKYPRTIENDKKLLKETGVDYLFLPDAGTIYSDQYQIQIQETELSKELEGEFRPGHFTGMLTVVLKLLNIIQATHAYFGEKDFQQLLLVKKMVSSLFLSTKIINCETLRADDGLALSSRNSRLSPEQRKLAANFPKILQSCSSLQKMKEELLNKGFKVDYIAEKWQRRLAAVWIDDIRLIDNIPL
jgi:pantoate--beta-alanine ligase